MLNNQECIDSVIASYLNNSLIGSILLSLTISFIFVGVLHSFIYIVYIISNENKSIINKAKIGGEMRNLETTATIL